MKRAMLFFFLIATAFSFTAAAQPARPAPIVYELACPAGYSPVPNSGRTFDSLTGLWRANFCVSGKGDGVMMCQMNGCLGGVGNSVAGSKLLRVDGNRADAYTADGTVYRPFKTIMAAVNQVIANGDNSTQIYQLDIAPATYVETVDLTNSALYNLILNGPGAKIAPSSGNALQNTNNNNLFQSTFIGLTFSGPVSFSYTVQGLSTDWIFFEHCTFFGNFTAVSPLGHSSPEYFFFDCTSGTMDWTFTNNYQIDFYACQLGQPDSSTSNFTINASGGAYTRVDLFATRANFASVTVGGAGGTAPNQARLYVHGGTELFGGPITVNGQLNLAGGQIDTAPITVNAGGSIGYRGGETDNPPTLSGGTLGFLNIWGAATFLGTTFQSGSFTGPTWTSGTGSPEGVKTAPIGSTFSRTDGSAGLSNYVKSTGTGNTGWLPIPAGAIASFNAPQKITSTGDITMTTSGTVYTLLSESVTMPASAGSYRVLVSYSQWLVTGGNVCSAEVIDTTNSRGWAPSQHNDNGLGWSALVGSELSTQTYAASATATFTLKAVCDGNGITAKEFSAQTGTLSPNLPSFLSVTPVLSN